MTEQQAPVMEAPSTPKNAPGQKQKRRKNRNMIVTAVVLVLVALGAFFLYRFLTNEDAVESTIQSQVVTLSSIQSMVQGSGNARAKESAAITLTQGGTVQEVFVTAGDVVFAGQPLYTIRSQAAEDEVTAARMV